MNKKNLSQITELIINDYTNISDKCKEYINNLNKIDCIYNSVDAIYIRKNIRNFLQNSWDWNTSAAHVIKNELIERI